MRLAPNRIHFLKFIVEGYDGLAVLSTVSGPAGLVELRYHPAVKSEVVALLDALAPAISDAKQA